MIKYWLPACIFHFGRKTKINFPASKIEKKRKIRNPKCICLPQKEQ